MASIIIFLGFIFQKKRGEFEMYPGIYSSFQAYKATFIAILTQVVYYINI